MFKINLEFNPVKDKLFVNSIITNQSDEPIMVPLWGNCFEAPNKDWKMSNNFFDIKKIGLNKKLYQGIFSKRIDIYEPLLNAIENHNQFQIKRMFKTYFKQLNPDESYNQNHELFTNYDLSEPGDYEIKVSFSLGLMGFIKLGEIDYEQMDFEYYESETVKFEII